MTITQHAHIYRIPTSNFNFGHFFFFFFFINSPPTKREPDKKSKKMLCPLRLKHSISFVLEVRNSSPYTKPSLGTMPVLSGNILLPRKLESPLGLTFMGQCMWQPVSRLKQPLRTVSHSICCLSFWMMQQRGRSTTLITSWRNRVGFLLGTSRIALSILTATLRIFRDWWIVPSARIQWEGSRV